MIFDVRTYRLHPGKTSQFFETYEKEGMGPQVHHLGNMVAFLQSHIGEQNQILHIWGYESIADREARRARLFADPAWINYMPKVQPLFQHMENKTMIPAPFWTPKQG